MRQYAITAVLLIELKKWSKKRFTSLPWPTTVGAPLLTLLLFKVSS